MNEDAEYRAWKSARREAEPPPGFADRVMAASGETGEREGRHVALVAAGLALAAVAFAVRVGSVLAFLLSGGGVG
jgi:hypothetical protein